MNILYRDTLSRASAQFIHFSKLEESKTSGKQSIGWLEKRRRRKEQLDKEEQDIIERWRKYGEENSVFDACFGEMEELYNFRLEKRPVKWLRIEFRRRILDPISEHFESLGRL